MDRSISWVAAQAIKAFLAAQDAKRAAIDAALGEADRGVFVSEAAVEAWIDSWGGAAERPFPEPDVFPDRPG